MESAKFYFHKRDTAKNPERTIYPIRLHFHYGGQPPFRYSTGEKWSDNEKMWDKKKSRPIGKSQEAQRLRTKLQNLESAILNAYANYKYLAANSELKLPKEPSHSVLLDLFLKELGIERPADVIEKQYPSLEEAFTDFLKTYSRNATTLFESARSAVKAFVEYQYPGKNLSTITCNQITPDFIQAFKDFLINPAGYNLVNQTANNYLINFRTMFKELIGVGTNNKGIEKYRSLELDTNWMEFERLPILKKSVKFYLTDKELYLLQHTKFWKIKGQYANVFAEVVLPVTHTCPGPKEHTHIRNAVDLYLFCIDTPLRISDLEQLEYSNIIQTEDSEGNKYHVVDMLQKKTKGHVRVVLSDRNTQMLERYKGLQPTPLPRLTRGPLWINLRKAFSSCSFLQYHVQYRAMKGNKVIVETMPKWEALHFHTSRNTFTTLGLIQGVPLTHVSQSMGHSTTVTTMKYDVSGEEDIAKSIRQFQNRQLHFDL